MVFFQIRQYGYILDKILPNLKQGSGIYKFLICIVIFAISLIKNNSKDSFAIQNTTIFFLGMSYQSILAGRLLQTMLPFLFCEIFSSKSAINNKITLILKSILVVIYVYGWYRFIST